jgi:hypothetical protein
LPEPNWQCVAASRASNELAKIGEAQLSLQGSTVVEKILMSATFVQFKKK